MSGKRKLFGTDGIRGRANAYPMTGEVMLELAPAGDDLLRLGVAGDTRDAAW